MGPVGSSLVKRTAAVVLEYEFDCEFLPKGTIHLALEQPEAYKIIFNGKSVRQKDAGYFADKSIRKIRLPAGIIIKGKNTLRLECAFNEEVDLEAVYLMGDFGVRLDGIKSTIISSVKTLKEGDITRQGLPFYAGRIFYKTDCKGFSKLGAEKVNGIALKVHSVAGSTLLGWQPFAASVAGNTAKLELFCTMGNALGIERLTENGTAMPLKEQGLCKIYGQV